MAILLGDGAFAMKAVGTAEHQEELHQIAAGIAPGTDALCGALLIPDPKNPFDPHAVAVVIESLVIGYLQNDAAPALKLSMRAGGFIAAGCAARIVDERGRLGVRLDASRPFQLRPIARETKPAPPPLPVARDLDRPVASAPQAAPFPRPMAPRVEREIVEELPPPEEVDLRPSLMRRFVMMCLQLALIVAILGGAYWWLKSLPREPADAARPAPAPTQPVTKTEPVEPAPPTVTAAPPPAFQWPDPPPAFQPTQPNPSPGFGAPPVVPPPPATQTDPAPQPTVAPPADPQATPAPPKAAKKKKRNKKIEEPGGPNAPLKIN